MNGHLHMLVTSYLTKKLSKQTGPTCWSDLLVEMLANMLYGLRPPLVFFDNSFKTPQQNKLKNISLHTETEKDIRWKNESLEFYMSARVTCKFGSFYVCFYHIINTE